jgi:hypothetical protein
MPPCYTSNLWFLAHQTYEKQNICYCISLAFAELISTCVDYTAIYTVGHLFQVQLGVHSYMKNFLILPLQL